jgi:hypothetical protein
MIYGDEDTQDDDDHRDDKHRDEDDAYYHLKTRRVLWPVSNQKDSTDGCYTRHLTGVRSVRSGQKNWCLTHTEKKDAPPPLDDKWRCY